MTYEANELSLLQALVARFKNHFDILNNSSSIVNINDESTENHSFPYFNNLRKKTKIAHCSDCVLVLHKVGNKLSQRGRANDKHTTTTFTSTSTSSSSSSFNSFRTNTSLWVEVDCGLFNHNMKHWSACSKWIDDTQSFMEKAVPIGSKAHYPNVPNLNSENWPDTYYGSDVYLRLQIEKKKWVIIL